MTERPEFQPREGITAEELTEELSSDPAWLARRAREVAAQERRAAAYDRAAAGLVEELARAGYEVQAVSDLYTRYRDYRTAIPILMKHFSKVAYPPVKEGIARALTDKAARPAAAPLMLEELLRLRSEQPSPMRFAVANALSELADDSMFETIVELAEDRRLAPGERGVLALALGRMDDSRAIATLRRFLNDRDLVPGALAGLARQRASEARQDVERFLDDPDPVIRNEAKKAARRITQKPR